MVVDVLGSGRKALKGRRRGRRGGLVEEGELAAWHAPLYHLALLRVCVYLSRVRVCVVGGGSEYTMRWVGRPAPLFQISSVLGWGLACEEILAKEARAAH